jgi:hypothetical protein
VARRVTVPAADDIFRPTVVPQPGEAASPDPQPEPSAAKATRTASGRVKHDEKMTVYVTADELLDIEHARLQLRRHHGLAVDRGRLVRAAVALALADLEAHGAESAVVQRLQES